MLHKNSTNRIMSTDSPPPPDHHKIPQPYPSLEKN